MSTLLLEQKHGLWRRVNRKRMSSLHRTSALARHAVTASRIPEPQVLKHTGTSQPSSVMFDTQGFLLQSVWCVTLTCRPCALTAAGLASECRGDAPVRPPAVISPMRPGGGAPRGGIWKGLCPRLPKPALTDPAVGRELDPYAGHLRKTHGNSFVRTNASWQRDARKR